MSNATFDKCGPWANVDKAKQEVIRVSSLPIQREEPYWNRLIEFLKNFLFFSSLRPNPKVLGFHDVKLKHWRLKIKFSAFRFNLIIKIRSLSSRNNFNHLICPVTFGSSVRLRLCFCCMYESRNPSIMTWILYPTRMTTFPFLGNFSKSKYLFPTKSLQK